MMGPHKYSSKNSQRCRVQKLCLQVGLILWQSCTPICHQHHKEGGYGRARAPTTAVWLSLDPAERTVLGVCWMLWPLHVPQPSLSAPPVLGSCSRVPKGDGWAGALTRSPFLAPKCSCPRCLLESCLSSITLQLPRLLQTSSHLCVLIVCQEFLLQTTSSLTAHPGKASFKQCRD